MKAIVKLKEKARSHEQKEEWELAIDAYREVLRLGEEQEGELELALFNRIGDLYLRLGRPPEAVDYYERAADRYAEAGLYNNAIALCNKALRYMPDRRPLFRQLGRLCAAQGFLVDARRWFLEFAERSSKAGDLEEALSALEEFASLSEDPAIRELLARQLQAHGRVEEALEQLTRAYGLHVRAGDDARARAVRDEVLALDPEADLDAALSLYEAEADEADGEGVADYGVIDPSAPALGGVSNRAGVSTRDDEDEEPAADSEAAGLAPEATPESIDIFGMVDIDAGDGEIAFEGADEGTFGEIDLNTAPALAEEDEEDEEDEEPEPLPLLGLDEDDAASDELDAEEAYALGDEEDEQEDAAPLPLLVSEEELDTSLPPPAAEEPSADGALPPLRFEEAEPQSAEEALDVTEEMNRARTLLARGDRRGALRVWDELHTALAGARRHEEALRVVSEMSEYAPDDIRLRQLRVEYATRLDTQPELVAAYVELAKALHRKGAETKARVVAQRVLDLEPAHAEARALLSEGAGAALQSDYVDLSGFLAIGEADEDTTRFVVSEKPPSGDEERDFADMLSQFKAKVAENVGTEDASSHYDLGLAFKEMGLIDEAVTEFQTALRGGEERLKVYEELGDCFVQKGQYNVAVKILSRALHLPHEEDAELLGVYYLLGRCYEELGQRAEARDAYERVVGLDLEFRDVPQRLAKL